MSDDWFRATRWTREAEEEFEKRLARAREYNRAQYLRIQGWTLIDAGAHRDGRALLVRVLTDYPDDGLQTAAALEHLAESHHATGDLDEAERYYREVVARRAPDGSGPNGTSGVTALSLAELLLERGGHERAAEAAQLLSDDGLANSLFFDVQHYRHAIANAHTAHTLGRRADAARWATRALDIAEQSAQRELLPRHPGIAKARPSRAETRELRCLARG